MQLIAGHCECGRALEWKATTGSGPYRESTCPCGRRHDVELGTSGWAAVAQLTPERSLPLAGFSTDLRTASDAERFWFSYPLRGDVALPVHILFSPSARKAEIKAADLKVYHLDDVSHPTTARRRWIGWWQHRRRAQRGGGLSPLVPPRVGRLPVSLIGTRSSPLAAD